MKRFAPLRALLVSLVLVSSLPACSKKKDSAGVEEKGPSITDIDLAKRIPASSTGFFIWDSTSEAYQQYSASAWGKSQSSKISKALEQLRANPASGEIAPFLDAILKSGLLGEDGKPPVVASAVAFVDPGSAEKQPALGAFMTGRKGTNLQEQLAVLKNTFQTEGYNVADYAGPPAGFTVAGPQLPDGSSALGKLFLVADASRAAIVTQESLIQRFFGDAPDNGIATIVASPLYQSTMQGVPAANQISFAFIDLKSTLARMRSGVAPETIREVEPVLDTFPVESVGFSQRYSNGLAGTGVAKVSPVSDVQKRWLGALTGGSSHETLEQAPRDSIIALTLDGGVLSKLKDLALAESQRPDAEMLKAQLAVLDSIKDLTVAVKAPSTVSAFPELVIIASGSDGAKLKSDMRTAIDGALASSGIQLGGWQTKTVEGGSIDFLMSPFGIGAYTAQAGNTFILATAEGSVVEALAAAKDGSKGLRARLGESPLRSITGQNSFGFAYTNFEKLVELVKSFQGSMAMFTGGANPAADQALLDLKDLGIFAGSIAYDGQRFRIESRYEATGNAK